MLQTRDVLVVLYDGIQSLDLTGPLEVFHAAGRIAAAGADRARTD
ncbi:hypothetical protein [Streptacidiphilus sp. MAP12-20]